MTAGSHQDNPKSNSMGRQFSRPDLWNLSSELVGAYNFEILVEDSDTGGPSPVTVRIEYLFAFQY